MYNDRAPRGVGAGRTTPNRNGGAMAVAKVVEITASSSESFEDAVKQGIARASETISDIKGAWIKEQKIDVQDGRIVDYRVNMMVTFVLKK
jgi:dodecin